MKYCKSKWIHDLSFVQYWSILTSFWTNVGIKKDDNTLSEGSSITIIFFFFRSFMEFGPLLSFASTWLTRVPFCQMRVVYLLDTYRRLLFFTFCSFPMTIRLNSSSLMPLELFLPSLPCSCCSVWNVQV